MGRRYRKNFWLALLLVVAAVFFVRGRPNATPNPTVANASPPTVGPPVSPKSSSAAQLSTPAAETKLHTSESVSRRDDQKAQLHLRVVGVHDGDTLTGLDDAKTQHKVRLDAIDAPELGQPFGQASKKALSEKVFGKDVVVIAKTRDKYGRTVGHVLIDGRDVNLEMLEEGMAWHYKKYDKNVRLSRAEGEARAAKRGLWQDRDPVPPWDWRKEQKNRRRTKP